MKQKQEVYISHVMFPWESFQAANEREERERANDGARWTDEFVSEVREHVLEYAARENLASRNSNLNDVYKKVPFHFRKEVFGGISFPIWN